MQLAQAMIPIAKRTIVVNFAGMGLKMEVKDPHTEWELRPSVIKRILWLICNLLRFDTNFQNQMRLLLLRV